MGRTDVDPSLNWYEGEIGFFDYYIIPLAKKLKECGVFGVSSDEYLNYALQNRNEWKDRGKELVSEMVELVRNKMETIKVTITPTHKEYENEMIEM
jgi:DNA-directed RNA polymerase specialized sigma54-like protein